jgi:hypothetical protein
MPARTSFLTGDLRCSSTAQDRPALPPRSNPGDCRGLAESLPMRATFAC